MYKNDQKFKSNTTVEAPPTVQKECGGLWKPEKAQVLRHSRRCRLMPPINLCISATHACGSGDNVHFLFFFLLFAFFALNFGPPAEWKDSVEGKYCNLNFSSTLYVIIFPLLLSFCLFVVLLLCKLTSSLE